MKRIEYGFFNFEFSSIINSTLRSFYIFFFHIFKCNLRMMRKREEKEFDFDTSFKIKPSFNFLLRSLPTILL